MPGMLLVRWNAARLVCRCAWYVGVLVLIWWRAGMPVYAGVMVGGMLVCLDDGIKNRHHACGIRVDVIVTYMISYRNGTFVLLAIAVWYSGERYFQRGTLFIDEFARIGLIGVKMPCAKV